jgi:hypothetical protein
MAAGPRTVDDHLAVLEGVAADISSLNRSRRFSDRRDPEMDRPASKRKP